jgi:FkbM family methyltransferase
MMIKTISTFFGPLIAIESDTRIAEEIQQVGHWEFNQLIEILNIYEKFYKGQTGTMLDIGCNIGSWSLPLAQRYQQNIILAIDCQPLVIDCINQTVELNYLTNVRVDCCAISDQCKEIRRNKIDYEWRANFGAYEFEPPMHESDFNGTFLPETEIIQTRRIDSFNLNDVVFIKLDIEGMEYQALNGAIDTIRRCLPFITFEHHKTDRERTNQLLKDLDYVIYNTIGQLTLAVPTKLINI